MAAMGGAGETSMILVGDHDANNLVDYQFKSRLEGRTWRRARARGSDCSGKRRVHMPILRMPLGTQVTDEGTGKVVAEIVADGQRIVLCKGGNGGWGNTHFKTSTNRAPAPGQSRPGRRAEARYRLILKSIADVGLVGFPNAGKSSLMTAITKAHPKTAAYPFTTLHPQIGVIEFPDGPAGLRRLQLADIPGLIEGASENKGLGHRFLRHIERCSLLLLLVDMAGTDGRDPRDDYKHLLRELKLYNPALLKKPRIVGANKMDVPAARAHLAKFKRSIRVPVMEISCLTGDGLEGLKKEMWKRVAALT